MYFVDHIPEAAIMIGFFLLIAFPVHEFSHAFAANYLGDSTARLFGRLTLNPIKHFHPVGGTMLVLSVLLAGVPLGFAATPVNRANLRGRYGEAIVAAAGPLSNFVLALIFAIPLRLLLSNPQVLVDMPRLYSIFALIVWGNIILGLFNLVPVPPLDGGSILLSILPPRTRWQIQPYLAQFGMLILIGVFILGGRVLGPIADAIYSVLVGS